MPVRGTGSHALRLGDVSTVVEDHQPLIGDAVSRAPSLLLVIEKFPGANTREVTKGVDAALADMAPGLTGITINPDIFRPVSYVQTRGWETSQSSRSSPSCCWSPGCSCSRLRGGRRSSPWSWCRCR